MPIVAGRRRCQGGVSAASALSRIVAESTEGASLSVPALSPIEQRIVLLVAGGRTNRMIADDLGVSARTVEWHLARACRKLEQTTTLHEQVQRAAPNAPPEGERE